MFLYATAPGSERYNQTPTIAESNTAVIAVIMPHSHVMSSTQHIYYFHQSEKNLLHTVQRHFSKEFIYCINNKQIDVRQMISTFPRIYMNYTNVTPRCSYWTGNPPYFPNIWWKVTFHRDVFLKIHICCLHPSPVHSTEPKKFRRLDHSQHGFHRRWPILCHKIDVWIHHFGRCCARRGSDGSWPERCGKVLV